MFLIRCTFWMTLVVLLLPANGAHDVFGQRDAATAHVTDVGDGARDTLRPDDLATPWQGPDHSG